MNLQEGFKSAIKSLHLNKARSLLTILGIIIGISSVILMSGLGNGIKENIVSNLKTMGSGNFTIQIDKDSKNYRDKYELNEEIKRIISKMKIVHSIAPTNSKRMNFEVNESKMKILPYECSFGSYETFPYNIVKGRYFTKEELTSSNQTILIDTLLEKKIFKDKSGVGKTISLGITSNSGITRKEKYYICGIIENPTEGAGILDSMFVENIILIPRSKFIHLIDNSKISLLLGKVENPNNLKSQMLDIKKMLDKITNTKDIYIVKKAGGVEDVEKILNNFELFITSVSFISLFVGGIGIMNIMLASVTERIREIGIKKAIGAKNKDILVQFLIESVFLSLLGGVIGIFIGVFLAQIVGFFIKIEPIFTTSIIAIALGASILIGITFGIIPAKKASKLNPIDALRS